LHNSAGLASPPLPNAASADRGSPRRSHSRTPPSSLHHASSNLSPCDYAPLSEASCDKQSPELSPGSSRQAGRQYPEFERRINRYEEIRSIYLLSYLCTRQQPQHWQPWTCKGMMLTGGRRCCALPVLGAFHASDLSPRELALPDATLLLPLFVPTSTTRRTAVLF
jgi:hypothetical protein